MKGSGTCNVCAAPCSSCMHINSEISYMESKAEAGGSSENSCGGKETENCLLSDADTPSYKRKQCETSVGTSSKVTAFKDDEDNQIAEDKPSCSSQLMPSECLGDNISCLTIHTDRNITSDDTRKEEMPCTSASALSNGIVSSSVLRAKKESSLSPKKHPVEERLRTDVVKCDIGEDNGNKDSPLDKTNCQESQSNPQEILEDDLSTAEVLEDDVKVCDICGDAGREDLLAICCRCSDGAEHTYCMRVMLDKLPEGDWLCEECLRKDLETLNAEKTETLSESNQKLGSSSGLKSPDIFTKKLEKIEPSCLPSSKSFLSRESSSKSLDSSKVKQINNVSIPSSSPAVSRTLAPSPSVSKTLSQPSRGLLIKSSSVSSLKPKVRQLTENIPQKPKESASGERKEGVVRTLTKSLSLKGVAPAGSSSAESVSKSQSITLPTQSKERILERKNSFIQSRNVTSKPLSSSQEPSASLSNEPSENASDKVKEPKKLLSSKTPGNSTIHEAATVAVSKEETIVGPMGDIRTEKLKESSTFSATSRQLAPPPKRITRCHKCNETGHSAQFCSIDRIRASASKPSNESVSTKVNKWKDAMDLAISKGKAQKTLPDRTEDISGSISLSKPVGNKENEPNSNEANEPNAASTKGEDLKRIVLEASRTSAFPQHDYIWQGSFELMRDGKHLEVREGFQAHLSTRASQKVPDVVTKFPEKVKLEEVNRSSSWPLQFKETGPTEDNIALFFFAKDLKSYEKDYKSLLESMLKNDIALRGNLDGTELLIFPSTKLPEKSQRWNRLFFLWGVFYERRTNLPEVKVKVKPPVLDLDAEPPVEEPLENGPCQGGEAPNCCRPRTKNWPPDLNLESQDTDDEPLEIHLKNFENAPVWGLPFHEKKRARSHSPQPWRVGPTEPNPASTSASGPASTSAAGPATTSVAQPATTSVARPATTSVAGSASTSVAGPATISVTGLSATSVATFSKVHPLLGGFEEAWHQVAPSEKPLFPLVSSAAAAGPAEELPDLELALGAEKRRPGKRGILPLPFQAAASKSQKRGDGGDDLAASLSLSLAFPFSAMEPPAAPPPLIKQPPPVSKSFLFDRFHQG